MPEQEFFPNDDVILDPMNAAGGGYYGEDVPEFDPEAAQKLREQEARRNKERQVGAKILSAVGFHEGRNKHMTERSLLRAERRGEKHKGQKAEKLNSSYVARLNEIIEKHGSEGEKKMWEASIRKAIPNAEDFPEEYFRAQERLLWNNYGREITLSESDKKEYIKDVRNTQKKALKQWGDYLAVTPLPTWFKVYAFDGVTKMSASYNNKKRMYEKRDKGFDAASFPALDAGSLARVHSVLKRTYGLEGGSDLDDVELKKLAKVGSFNKLYSYFHDTRVNRIKTPEREEDVKGEWIAYGLEDCEEIARAAEGTPWCIKDPDVADNYLRFGDYGGEGINEYEHNAEDGLAQFLLFHLQDEDGKTSGVASASIRLDLDGDVAEISGLNKDQGLEDSLVPIVEAKTKSLPNGEKFLEAFADKKELIRLDRMRRAEKTDFTQDDLNFVFELDREIKILDTYSDGDERVPLLREYISEHLKDIKEQNEGVDIGLFARKLIDADDAWVVAENLSQFVEAGANIDSTQLARDLISTDRAWVVVGNLSQFVEAGVDPAQLVRDLTDAGEAYAVVDNLFQFVELGVDSTQLARDLINTGAIFVVAENLSQFVEAGADIDSTQLAKDLIDADEAWVVANDLSQFIEAGANIDPAQFAKDLIDADKAWGVANNLSQFIEVGVDPTQLAKDLIDADKAWIVEDNLSQFIEAGADLTRLAIDLIDAGKAWGVTSNLSQFVEAGANPTQLAMDLIGTDKSWVVAENLSRFIEAGANPTQLVRKLIDVGETQVVADNLPQFVEAGANIDSTQLARKLIDAGQAWVVANNFSQFVEAGANIDSTQLAKDLIDAGKDWTIAHNLSQFIEMGVDPTQLAKDLIDAGQAWVVANNLSQFIDAGANREELERMLEQAKNAS